MYMGQKRDIDGCFRKMYLDLIQGRDCGQGLLCSVLFLFAECCINCALIDVIKLMIGESWLCKSTES